MRLSKKKSSASMCFEMLRGCFVSFINEKQVKSCFRKWSIDIDLYYLVNIRIFNSKLPHNYVEKYLKIIKQPTGVYTKTQGVICTLLLSLCRCLVFVFLLFLFFFFPFLLRSENKEIRRASRF